jgi:hypothetical protein
MKAVASTVTRTQVPVAYAGAVRSLTAICATERAPHPHPGYRPAVTRVEPEDLTRFEGEGGPEAPEPDAPLHPQECSANESKNL